MVSFKVYTLEDSQWTTYLSKANQYDFHHTSCFHQIECKLNEKPLLFVSEDKKGEFIAVPLIIKPIPGTNYFDANSVYGYGGPIASKHFKEFSKEELIFFKKNLLDYCLKNDVISIFSRLHPLINTSEFFNSFGKVKKLNKVVAVDLTEPIDIQRQHYSRSYKNQINKLKKKKGYTVRKLDYKNIDVFKDIYFETMRRVNAKDYYFFSEEYLIHLVENECYRTVILVAYNNEGIPASAAIYTISKNFMQYHLGGTKDFALKDAPIKYIMDEARLLGSSLGLSYFNLGGGVGGSDEDSLFRFKSGFSKSLFQFSVWNLIVDQKAYDNLVKEKNIDKFEHPNFFPLYRAR